MLSSMLEQDFEAVLSQGLAPNDEVESYWQQVYDNLTATPQAGAPSKSAVVLLQLTRMLMSVCWRFAEA